MFDPDFLGEHVRLSRRYFLQTGMISLAGASVGTNFLSGADQVSSPSNKIVKPEKAGAFREPYLTPAEDFRDVSRGKPVPHSLSEEKQREVGLTRETWKLEVISDPDHPAKLGDELTIAAGNALDFAGLLKLGEKHVVRFPKVMTCLNLGCPLGMGLWEGVPLREVLWMTRPRENLRRVFLLWISQ